MLLGTPAHVPFANHVDVITSHAHGSLAFLVFVHVLHSFTVVLTATEVGATLFHVQVAFLIIHSFPKLSLVFAHIVVVFGPSFHGAAIVYVAALHRVPNVVPFVL